MLPVEEEHRSWYKGDVEISGVNRHAVDVNNEDSRHLGNGVLIFGQLKRPTAMITEMFQRNRRTGAEHAVLASIYSVMRTNNFIQLHAHQVVFLSKS